MDNIFKHSVKSGAIGAGIVIAMYLAIYLVAESLFFSGWISILYFIILTIVCIVYGQKLRDENTNALSYGRAYLGSLLIGTVMMAIYYIFEYLMCSVIDPQLLYAFIDAGLEQLKEWKDSMEPEVYKMQVANTIGIENQYGLTMVLQFVGRVISMAIWSLILALFIWKRKPR